MQTQIRNDGVFIPKSLFKKFDNIQIIEKPDIVIIKSRSLQKTQESWKSNISVEELLIKLTEYESKDVKLDAQQTATCLYGLTKGSKMTSNSFASLKHEEINLEN